jgi:hypothetical protein
VRSVHNGLGSFNFPDDHVTLHEIRTQSPFKVTMPDVGAISWRGGSVQTVTWDVGGTDAAPVSCSLVDISLSVDGGYTYPVPVASGLPNTGSAVITVPNVHTTSAARIKIKARDNVFFDISNEHFEIVHDDNLPYPDGISTAYLPADSITIYPVPAHTYVHVRSRNDVPLRVDVYNVHGQVIWSGTLDRELDVPVSGWPGGIYYFRFSDVAGSGHTTKRVLIQ